MDATFVLTTDEFEHLKNGGICLIRADGDGFKIEAVKRKQARIQLFVKPTIKNQTNRGGAR